jgi:hypothetical protein
MCFSSKVKTPKVNTALPAPEPVVLEDPKGIDYGGEESGSENSGDENSTKNIARIDLDEDKGDGTKKAVATDKGFSTAKKFSYTNSAVRKNLSKKAKS